MAVLYYEITNRVQSFSNCVAYYIAISDYAVVCRVALLRGVDLTN